MSDAPSRPESDAEGRGVAAGDPGSIVGSPETPTPPESPGRRGYYGLPVLKRPVWRWEVWTYFFCGGLAAGAFAVASLALLGGGARDRGIARTGYLISFGALLACPPLLIKDLGRPGRFLNMLRIFKPESPMSAGVWGLCFFSICTSLQAARQLFESSPGWAGALVRLIPTRVVAIVGTALACFFGSYTGVLLSTTSIPVWSRSRLLAPAFLASAFSAGVSAISLALALRPERSPRALERLERLERLVLVGEGLALAGYVRGTGEPARPLLTRSEYGPAFLGGAVGLGLVVPALVGLFAPDQPRAVALGSLAALIGGLCLRYAIVMAGHTSAADGEGYLRETDQPR